MGIDYLKKQGVKLGGAPYGMRYTDDVEEHGWRVLAEDPLEQWAIERMRALFDLGFSKHRTL